MRRRIPHAGDHTRRPSTGRLTIPAAFWQRRIRLDAVISAPAATLLLLLWRRRGVDTAGVTVEGGDDTVARATLTP